MIAVAWAWLWRHTSRSRSPLDPGGLADCLQQLLSNPGLRAKLGASAREWVARDRTWAADSSPVT